MKIIRLRKNIYLWWKHFDMPNLQLYELFVKDREAYFDKLTAHIDKYSEESNYYKRIKNEDENSFEFKVGSFRFLLECEINLKKKVNTFKTYHLQSIEDYHLLGRITKPHLTFQVVDEDCWFIDEPAIVGSAPNNEKIRNFPEDYLNRLEQELYDNLRP